MMDGWWLDDGWVMDGWWALVVDWSVIVSFASTGWVRCIYCDTGEAFLMRVETGWWWMKVNDGNKNYSRETVCLCLVCSVALGFLEKKQLWIICSSCSACAEIKKRSGTVQRISNVSFPWHSELLQTIWNQIWVRLKAQKVIWQLHLQQQPCTCYLL